MRMAAREEPDLEKGAPSPITGAAATGSSMNSMEGKVPDLKERLEKILKEKDVDYEKHCIFRVPGNLRAVHEREDGYNPYNPQMVSIGPYHRQDSRLQAMQKHKERLLRKFLLRKFRHPTKVDLDRYLDRCIKTMEDLEQEARDCYAGIEDIEKIKSCEFVEMMLLDGCFILELFHSFRPDGSHSNSDPAGSYSKSDPLFSVMSCIRRDLLMLENQIPLSVLEQLFKLTVVEGPEDNKNDHVQGDGNNLHFLALHFFNPAIEVGADPKNVDVIQGNNSDSTKHLLHIIRQSLLPSGTKKPQSKKCPSIHKCWGKKKKQGENDRKGMSHCVSELKYHGLEFKVANPKRKLMDISFGKSHLEIPQLDINDSTQCILLNLMAFEQCYSKCGRKYVTSYVHFMDGLINDPLDVFLLQEKKIIVHRLGSEEDVAHLFNNLCQEMALDTDNPENDPGNDQPMELFGQLEEFLGKRRHRWFAMLKRKHLENPWAIISIVAATLLLILTTLGTLYAILSFHIHHA